MSSGLSQAIAGSRGPNRYADIGKFGTGALMAGSMAPFPYGAPFSLAKMGLQGFNTAVTDNIRDTVGVKPLSFGQGLAGVLGLNNMGNTSGNPTIASPEDYHNPLNNEPTGISRQGTENTGLFGTGIGAGLGWGPTEGRMTPDEARMRNFMANPSSFLMPGSNIAPGPMKPGTYFGGSPLASAIAGPAVAPTNPGMPGMATPNGPVLGKGMVAPDGTHQIPKAFMGTMQASQFGYDANGNYTGVGTPTSGNPGNFAAGQGAPGTVAGGTFGNAQTGGMAGPVNQNTATGMLSRI